MLFFQEDVIVCIKCKHSVHMGCSDFPCTELNTGIFIKFISILNNDNYICLISDIIKVGLH